MSGTHPMFHDLDRAEVIRRFRTSPRSVPATWSDVEVLVRLLEDAHERLAVYENTEIVALQEQIDELTVECGELKTEIDVVEGRRSRFETAAKAFEYLCLAGLVPDAGALAQKLSTDRREVVARARNNLTEGKGLD